MASPMFVKPPDRIQRFDVAVMQQTTVDPVAHIQKLWPDFETLVGLHGRKMTDWWIWTSTPTRRARRSAMVTSLTASDYGWDTARRDLPAGPSRR